MPIHRAGGGVYPATSPNVTTPPLGPLPPVFVAEPVVGPAGVDSFTQLTGSFVMPAADNTTQVVASMKDPSWIGVGQTIFIENAGALTAVLIIRDLVHLVNPGGVGNASPSTVIPYNSKVSPGGGAGGGGSLSGDVTGQTTATVVSAIQGIATPGPSTASAGQALVTQASGPVLFTSPFGFYFDATNNVLWVADVTTNTLVGFNPDTFAVVANVDLSTYTTSGVNRIVADTGYLFLCGPGFNSPDQILVVSKMTHAVVGILSVAPSSGQAWDMAVDGAGDVWATNVGGTGSLVKFLPADIIAAISSFPTPQLPTGGTFLGSSAAPYSVCYEPVLDQIWVSGDGTPPDLWQMTTAGVIVNSSTLSGQPGYGFGIAIASGNGFVWAAGDGPDVYQINPATFPAGGSITSFAAGNVGQQCGYITYDSFTNTILVGDYFGSGYISRYSAIASPALVSTLGPFTAGFNQAALATSSSKLWLADGSKAEVDLYTNVVGSETLEKIYTGQSLSLAYGAVGSLNENNGVALPSRKYTNFEPPLIAIDNPGSNRTDVTAIVHYQTIENAGVGVTQRGIINFVGATVADDVVGNRTTISGLQGATGGTGATGPTGPGPTGTPSNHYATTSPGNYAQIAATETDLGYGGSWGANGAVCGQTTTDATFHDIITFTPAVHIAHRVSLTILGRNHANNGDEFSCDIVFHMSTDSGGITPATPALLNLTTTGGGSSYNAQVTYSAGTLHVQVQGAAATTVDWTCAVQDIVRS